jgi:hypothetical protein
MLWFVGLLPAQYTLRSELKLIVGPLKRHDELRIPVYAKVRR